MAATMLQAGRVESCNDESLRQKHWWKACTECLQKDTAASHSPSPTVTAAAAAATATAAPAPAATTTLSRSARRPHWPRH
jgi:hypothetical protein